MRMTTLWLYLFSIQSPPTVLHSLFLLYLPDAEFVRDWRKLLENRPGVDLERTGAEWRFWDAQPIRCADTCCGIWGVRMSRMHKSNQTSRASLHTSVYWTYIKTMTTKHTNIRCLYYNNGLGEKRPPKRKFSVQIAESYVTDKKAGVTQRNINIQEHPEPLQAKQCASNQNPGNG